MAQRAQRGKLLTAKGAKEGREVREGMRYERSVAVPSK